MQAVERLQTAFGDLRKEMGRTIIGQGDIVEQLVIAMLCRGHCLLVGVPGLAKTLMISTLSQVLDLRFNRVQFTPDLMPSDITGTEVIEENQSTGQKDFKFFRGPVFANILLADEINRTPPKTQAALLQAMQEHQVTVSGTTYTLDEPFFVLATQNPIEQEGTYPLPEAQLDRFMFMLRLDYPSFEDEVAIVKATTGGSSVDHRPLLDAAQILELQQLVRKTPVADNVIQRAVKLVSMTRPGGELAPDFVSQQVSWGAGPRASQYLVLGAKCRAILHGRPTPDIADLHEVALPVLRHRVLTSFAAEAEGVRSDDVIQRLLEL
ncbi:MAG: MoxR family ATPase [Candidatus Delongbacteria bacterium]|nr:MoxR family ATPase [Candidatus Delongbacteria bacterium]